jgi:multiple sugar transport system substrate-binding protein
MNLSLRRALVVCLCLIPAFLFAAGQNERTGTAVAAMSSAGGRTITLWDFLSGGDGVRWKQIISDFNDSQKEIHVNQTTLTWGDPFYTKVHTAVVAGQAPDVMTYHLSHFAAGIRAGDLRPITDSELKTVGLSRSDFNPALIDRSLAISATYGHANELYGVPLDTHTSVLYYNKDALRKAGLLGPDGTPQGLTSMESFTAALEKIKSETGLIPMAMSSADDPATVWRMWFTLFSQQGGSLASNGTLTLGDLDTYGRAALDVMANWTRRGLVPDNIAYPAAVALFSSGRAAMMFNGNWEVPTMVDLKKSGKLPFDYGVMAFPRLYANRDTWADSHNLSIPASTKSAMTGSKLHDVLTFIAYVEKHADIWAGGGHIPAYLPVLNGPAMASMVPNNEYSAQAAKDVVFEPVNPIFGVGDPAYDAVGNFLSPALTGKLSVGDAISKFKDQLQSLAK